MIGLGLVLFTLVGVVVLACAAYLFALSVFAALPAAEREEAVSWLRFDVVVPAHDEEAGIAWVPYMMWRLDKYHQEYRRMVPFLEERPSDYMKRQMWFATQPVEEPGWVHLSCLQRGGVDFASRRLASDQPGGERQRHPR